VSPDGQAVVVVRAEDFDRGRSHERRPGGVELDLERPQDTTRDIEW
jgi:hypothetical protein